MRPFIVAIRGPLGEFELFGMFKDEAEAESWTKDNVKEHERFNIVRVSMVKDNTHYISRDSCCEVTRWLPD